MRYTPGPWKVIGDSAGIQGGDGFIVADATRAKNPKVYSGKNKGDEKANAHLIAASPELLEVCKETLNELESMTTDRFSRGMDKPIREVSIHAPTRGATFRFILINNFISKYISNFHFLPSFYTP